MFHSVLENYNEINNRKHKIQLRDTELRSVMNNANLRHGITPSYSGISQNQEV